MDNLHYLNLRNQGFTDKEAKAKIAASEKPTDKAEEGKTKKPTAGERKAIFAEQITALDGQVPAEGASLAKFEEALAAAQEAQSGETTEEML